MSVTNSPRLDITRWSADSDPFTRSQLDTSHQRLEERAAGFFSGTDRSTRDPAIFVRSFFYDTDDGILYYSDGTEWQNLTEFGGLGAISANTPGNTAFEGENDNAARSDHRHAMPSWGSTGELAQIGTTAAQGNNDKFARINHVHVLANNSVTAGKIADGAINNSSAFSASVVNNAAIGTGAVTKAKIHPDQQIPSGSIWAFGGTTTPPTGWLFCNGAPYSTSVHPDLFNVIGYSYGGSSGTFLVPDLTDRMPRGAADVTTTLGVSAGSNAVTIGANNLPNHTHGATGLTVDNHPVHTHLLNGVGATAVSNSNADHVHNVPGQTITGQVDNPNIRSISGAGQFGGVFYVPSTVPWPNNDAGGGLRPNYFSGGGHEYPVANSFGILADNRVTTSRAAINTNDANNQTTHGHSVSGSTQNPSVTLNHVVGGATGNPTGAVGDLLTVLPKTQTVNYIIKL
jgi:microcystin-dependent protein